MSLDKMSKTKASLGPQRIIGITDS